MQEAGRNQTKTDVDRYRKPFRKAWVHSQIQFVFSPSHRNQEAMLHPYITSRRSKIPRPTHGQAISCKPVPQTRCLAGYLNMAFMPNAFGRAVNRLTIPAKRVPKRRALALPFAHFVNYHRNSMATLFSGVSVVENGLSRTSRLSGRLPRKRDAGMELSARRR